MGVDLIVMAGMAAAGAAMSAKAARDRNKAIGRSITAQQQAAGVQNQQLADQTAVENMKTMRAAHQLQGRVRVAAGEAGATAGGSFAALDRQTAFDAGLNLAIGRQNLGNNQALVNSQYKAQATGAMSQWQNPLMAGFMGGVSGAQTGLAIGGTASSIGSLASAGGGSSPIATGDFTIGGSPFA